MEPYAPLPQKPGCDIFNETCVRTPALWLSAGQHAPRLSFSGTRADVVFKPGAERGVFVRLPRLHVKAQHDVLVTNVEPPICDDWVRPTVFRASVGLVKVALFPVAVRGGLD